MSDSIKTARTIDINNISVHLNDNEKNIEIVAEYEEFDYKSVIFPVSDWEAVKSAIEDLLTNGSTDEWVKKPVKKKLTQAVFNGQPDCIKSAAIDKDGDVWLYQVTRDKLIVDEVEGEHEDDSEWRVTFAGSEYDATDWQNSAIDRIQ